MFGKSKIFVALAFVFTLIFAATTSEAGVVTDRTPLQCYVDKRVDSYNAPNGQKVGWIDPEVDLIQVLEIRPDGWARGTHPSGQKRVERWFRIADLCADPGYSNRGIRISGHHDVYRTRGSNTKFGSVSNEDVIVLAEVGNRSQILYNIKGGYKMGWIVKSDPDVKQRLLNTIFGRSGGRISCDFDGYVNTSGRHEGIDMVLRDGAEIHAIASGVVTKAGGDRINTVAIYDSNNNKTIVYLHMGSVHVHSGQYVNKGDVIGTQGSTGASSSHIHVEVRNGQHSAAAKSVNDYNLENSNPYDYLSRIL